MTVALYSCCKCKSEGTGIDGSCAFCEHVFCTSCPASVAGDGPLMNPLLASPTCSTCGREFDPDQEGDPQPCPLCATEQQQVTDALATLAKRALQRDRDLGGLPGMRNGWRD